MAFEGAGIEELTGCFEEPVIIERGVMDDEISDIGIAPVFVGVDDGAVRERMSRRDS